MRFVPFLLTTMLAGGLGILSFPYAAAAQQCGDVNCSGSVTSTDALAVLRKAVGLGTALVCASGCSTTTTTTLPQDLPCACAAACAFVCPDKTMVPEQCVISSAGLNPGECLCTALCPSLPPLCGAACDLSPCDLPCPGGATVPGFCDTQDPQGCLCSNLEAAPCP